MASVVEICNIGLVSIGAEPIMSLDDDTDAARACRTFYPSVRDKTLAEHLWNFATSRASLAREATPPAFGYNYAYTLPSDNIRVFTMEDEDFYPWREEGRSLLTNAGEAKIIYVRREEDTTRYSPAFVDALAAHLAWKLCTPLTSKRGTAQDFYQYYLQALKDAKAIDGQTGTPVRDEASEYDDVRQE